MNGVLKVIARGIFFIAYPVLRVLYPMKIHWEDRKATEKALEGSCIVFSNHLGYVEGLFITRLLHRYRVWTFVGKDWYDKKPINWLFRNLPYISIDRKSGMDTDWLEKTTGIMKDGASVYILPEGHTSPAGCMDTFKPGFLVLAKQTDATPVPMFISRKIKPFRLTHLVIGKPLDFDLHEKGRPSLVLKKYCEESRSYIEGLGEKLKNGEV
ncbi:MAG: 1-acyl-sn-glycerol-3-phosphate acyltransferase [Lachnospiraceae bacterium]|nr:1-acyl-sn-glycerol-3-phosphate acyltransferase [Lachnospiraceae bacterium]